MGHSAQLVRYNVNKFAMVQAIRTCEHDSPPVVTIRATPT